MSQAVKLEKITKDESWGLFDAAARRLLSLSGDEFVQRWDTGHFANDHRVSVMKVAMLRPGGR